MGGGGSYSRRSGGGSSGTTTTSGDTSDSQVDIESVEEGDICIFDEEATLASPNRGPLSNISVGDVLDVGIDGASVVVITDSGDVVGSMTESWVGQLRECIELGHEYEAEVESITGGQCDVIVRNK